MFAEDWPEPGRKRIREDEYEDVVIGGTLGFTEHRSKRLQSLPVRTSPNSKRWYTAGDPDVDMDIDLNQTATFTDPQHLDPGSFQPDVTANSLAGRMPTPIHCSFAAQIRGSIWGVPPGNTVRPSGLTPPYQPDNTGFGSISTKEDGFSNLTRPGPDKPVFRLDRPAALADWTMVQNRRLPSPISESGAEDVGSQRMNLDNSAHMTHGHSRPAGLQRASSAVELALSAREGSFVSVLSDSCASATAGPLDGMMEVEPPLGTQSPKKGHTRSRHTVNNWTLEPGMKKSFSIGYRADCEKCRMKVPGHFNHIIIS
ncbi:hypothetical protein NKR23_g7196 [Pleurostoma richardsiae]|uniref:Uncharacterized protein n=1 Tax=Pleurostoma richardsiae TaxID=41990 RepID=A0AA38RIG8_9PEZI|nr:hypothetical protein NKR23_g7196 [Pleurostoma richardsiae]